MKNFLEQLQIFWNFLNGKKTKIAAYIMLVPAFLVTVVEGQMNVHAAWVGTCITVFSWIGLTLGGTGTAHGIVKALNKPA